MKNYLKNYKIQPPQIIISFFLIALICLAFILEMNLVVLLNESLIKLVMNGILVLSLIPMINAGAGMNFGLPVGITGGLIGLCLAVNFRMTGLFGFVMSLLFSLVICLFLGWIYGLILNKVKGREEIAGTFIGFSFIPLMNYFWTLVPFQNREMLYPIGGQGLRPKISLENYFSNVLDDMWLLRVGSLEIPAGLFAFYGLVCLFIYLFFRRKLVGQPLPWGK